MSTEVEEELCKVGFSPTKTQILDLVHDFVETNKIKNPFKNNRPGKDWLHAFMERNRLSMKKANMISTARLSAMANPFVIYDFYDTIEKIITEKNQIWNCAHSGFPMDPSRC